MKKYKYILHKIILFIGMLFLYEAVYKYFGYFGFTYNFDSTRFVFSLVSFFIVSFLFRKKVNQFYKTFLVYWDLFIFLPMSVLFSVSLLSYYHYLIHFIFFSIILVLFNFNNKVFSKRRNAKKIKFESNKFLVFFWGILLSLPLIEVFVNFNINSFNLLNVYDIRLSARETNRSKIVGYLKEALSRVLYPFFMIYGYINKNLFLLVSGLIGIILVFASTGALKSILAVIPVAFLFINIKSYEIVCKRLIIIMYVIVFLPILETYFFNTIFFTDLPARRLLFVPGLLENAFVTEYGDNPQFYLNTMLKSLNPNPEVITKLIGGKYFNKPDMNANVGVVIDGFVNLGFFGIIMNSLIIYFVIAILNGLKISPRYFGIFFVYFYYMNTSFIGTLFLTHGMLFLLLFFYFIKTDHESSTYLPKF